MAQSTGSPWSNPRKYTMFGLTLIILFLLLGYAMQVGLLSGFDTTVFVAINSAHTDFLDGLMVVSSQYGREVVWGALMIGLFALGGKKEKKAAITLVLVFVVLTGVGYAAKEVYSRQRPYDAMTGVRLIVDEESDGSYPSGHTLIVAGGTVVVWLYLRSVWAALLTVEAGFVAYSRMYVGVHYPSDIIGGVLLGVGCALIISSYPKFVDRVYEALPSSLREK